MLNLEEIKKIELKGSEKQIAWAESIRKDWIDRYEERIENREAILKALREDNFEKKNKLLTPEISLTAGLGIERIRTDEETIFGYRTVSVLDIFKEKVDKEFYAEYGGKEKYKEIFSSENRKADPALKAKHHQNILDREIKAREMLYKWEDDQMEKRFAVTDAAWWIENR